MKSVQDPVVPFRLAQSMPHTSASVVCQSYQAKELRLQLEYLYQGMAHREEIPTVKVYLRGPHKHYGQQLRGKTRALLPLPDIQHNTFFEDAMTCDVVPELLGFNGHTIITLCGSKVINILLPVLS